MATLPSPDPERYGPVHLLRRAQSPSKAVAANGAPLQAKQMNKWGLAFALVAVLILGLLLGAHVAPGRYRITEANRQIYLCDSIRGDVWMWDYGQKVWSRTQLTRPFNEQIEAAAKQAGQEKNPFDKFDADEYLKKKEAEPSK